MSGKWTICHAVELGTGCRHLKAQHIITLFIDQQVQYMERNKKEEGLVMEI